MLDECLERAPALNPEGKEAVERVGLVDEVPEVGALDGGLGAELTHGHHPAPDTLFPAWEQRVGKA